MPIRSLLRAQVANRVHRMSESAGEWSRVWRLPTRRRGSGRVGSAGTGPSGDRTFRGRGRSAASKL